MPKINEFLLILCIQFDNTDFMSHVYYNSLVSNRIMNIQYFLYLQNQS